jgi:hypothetical protein
VCRQSTKGELRVMVVAGAQRVEHALEVAGSPQNMQGDGQE